MICSPVGEESSVVPFTGAKVKRWSEEIPEIQKVKSKIAEVVDKTAENLHPNSWNDTDIEGMRQRTVENRNRPFGP